MIKRAALLALCLLLLVGCAAPKQEEKGNTVEYKRISAEDAKKMMDEQEAFVLLDVRTQAEYEQIRIPGAKLLPNTDIAAKAGSELPDKGALILVYCRSGNRSKTASEELIRLGYTNVYDFGGINTWPFETAAGAE